jgi:hypothetical protein
MVEAQRDHSTSDERYEPPEPDPTLVADLKAAIATVPDLHEAYLVTRRRSYEGRETVDLGFVAHVGGRWRVRRQLRSLREALQPFYPPPPESRLHWGAYGNSPVPDKVRAVGIPLM